MKQQAAAVAEHLDDDVLPATYSTLKPDTIPLNKVYVHVGHEKIYFGRGGDLKKGGLVRVRAEAFGPQRDPLERLSWAQERANDFKAYLFADPSHVVEDENGEYDDTDGGGRALIAHICGHPTIEAFVSKNVSLAMRAKRFRDHGNSRVALGAVQTFLSRVAEGDKRHVRIKNAIAPNYKIKRSGIDAINSVAALYDVYDCAGEDVLKRTAQLCGAAWRPKFKKIKGGVQRPIPHSGHHVDGILFVAVALIVVALPAKYDEEKLRTYLKNHSPKEIKDETMKEINKLAERSTKRAPRVVMQLLSQHLAVPMASTIARGYHKGLDTSKYQLIDMDAIADCPLAEQFKKLRSGGRANKD